MSPLRSSLLHLQKSRQDAHFFWANSSLEFQTPELFENERTSSTERRTLEKIRGSMSSSWIANSCIVGKLILHNLYVLLFLLINYLPPSNHGNKNFCVSMATQGIITKKIGAYSYEECLLKYCKVSLRLDKDKLVKHVHPVHQYFMGGTFQTSQGRKHLCPPKIRLQTLLRAEFLGHQESTRGVGLAREVSEVFSVSIEVSNGADNLLPCCFPLPQRSRA